MGERGRTAAHELRNLLGLIALEVHAAAAGANDPVATRRSLTEIANLLARCTDVVASIEEREGKPAPRDPVRDRE